MATQPNLTSTLSHLNDREKLMLISAAMDSLLDQGAADELADGLAAAFERVELTYGMARPYPHTAADRNAWVAWRAERDAVLSRRGLSL